MEPMYPKVGQRIRMYRKKISITQHELAARVDRSVQYISDLENGKKSFSIDTFIQIVNILGISSDDLLQDYLVRPVSNNHDYERLQQAIQAQNRRIADSVARFVLDQLSQIK